MNSLSVPLTCDASQEASWAYRHRALLTGLALVFAAWLVYLPSVWHGFVYFDDVRLLRDHPELYGQPTLGEDFKAIFSTAFPREEPLLLRDVAWAVQSRIFGFGNPLGYHLLNVTLHGAVVGLVFVFLLQLTRRYWFALATTSAWFLLAVHTEPVNWIMGSKDIMSGLFMLLALCAQTKRLAATSSLPRWLWYTATVAFLICGLFSKVSVLTFPLVLLLHALLLPYLQGERSGKAALPSFRTILRESALALPCFAISGLVYVWYSRILTEMGIFDRGYNPRGHEHLVNVLVLDPLSMWMYLKQIFFPSSLSVFYTTPSCQTSYTLWQISAALITIALVTTIGIWLFCRRKDLFFYYAAFFILMVPYMNLAYMGFLVADRYVYFASLFAILVVGALVGEWLKHPQSAVRFAVMIVAGVVLVGNLIQKLNYQPAWQNAETLWQHHIALADPSPESFANLAAYYYSQAAAAQGNPEADAALRKMAVVVDAGLKQLWPDRKSPPSNEIWNLVFLQSIVQEVTGTPQDALASLLLADQLRPRFDSINLNLARLYSRLAQSAQDPTQRQTYAQNARDRFTTYIQITFRGRTPPPEVSQELARLEDNYRLLSVKPGA